MVLEYLAARELVWADARIAVPAVLVFTTLTSIATLRHLDAFHFGADNAALPRAIAWVWLAVYVVVPPLLAWLWWRQARAPLADPPRRYPIPRALRLLLAVQAVVMSGLGALLRCSTGRARGSGCMSGCWSRLSRRACGGWQRCVARACAVRE